MVYHAMKDPATAPVQRPVGMNDAEQIDFQHSHTSESPGGQRDPSHSRVSASNRPSMLKRAVSSPNINSLGTGDALTIASEKKRNKLQYHRIAVACGFCRRRKIRCIPSANDMNHCQNCIRLNKVCQFFPVDQPSPPTGRPVHASSKGETMNDINASVPSSSPSVLGSSGVDNAYDVYDHLWTPSLPPQPPSIVSQDGSDGQQSEPVFRHRAEGFHVSDQHQEHVYAQEFSRAQSSSAIRSHDPSPLQNYPYPVPQESYPHYYPPGIPASASLVASSPSAAFHSQHTSPSSDQHTWAPAPLYRSMSFADAEGMNNTYAAYYRSNTHPTIGYGFSSGGQTSPSHAPFGHVHDKPLHGTAAEAFPNMHAIGSNVSYIGTWPATMAPASAHPLASFKPIFQVPSYHQLHRGGLGDVQEEQNSVRSQLPYHHPPIYQQNSG